MQFCPLCVWGEVFFQRVRKRRISGLWLKLWSITDGSLAWGWDFIPHNGWLQSLRSHRDDIRHLVWGYKLCLMRRFLFVWLISAVSLSLCWMRRNLSMLWTRPGGWKSNVDTSARKYLHSWSKNRGCYIQPHFVLILLNGLCIRSYEHSTKWSWLISMLQYCVSLLF